MLKRRLVYDRKDTWSSVHVRVRSIYNWLFSGLLNKRKSTKEKMSNFKFNEYGVCENTATAVSWSGKHTSIHVSVAQYENEWCRGYGFSSNKKCYEGCGCPCTTTPRFRSVNDAVKSALQDLRRRLHYDQEALKAIDEKMANLIFVQQTLF